MCVDVKVDTRWYGYEERSRESRIEGVGRERTDGEEGRVREGIGIEDKGSREKEREREKGGTSNYHMGRLIARIVFLALLHQPRERL